MLCQFEVAALRRLVSINLKQPSQERTLLSVTKDVGFNTSLFVRSSVQLLFEQSLDSAARGGGFRKPTMRDAGALDSQSLVHNRASSSNELQVGDGTATRRVVGSGRQGPQSAGRSLLQERANALGVREESFHGLLSTARAATMTDGK